MTAPNVMTTEGLWQAVCDAWISAKLEVRSGVQTPIQQLYSAYIRDNPNDYSGIRQFCKILTSRYPIKERRHRIGGRLERVYQDIAFKTNSQETAITQEAAASLATDMSTIPTLSMVGNNTDVQLLSSPQDVVVLESTPNKRKNSGASEEMLSAGKNKKVRNDGLSSGPDQSKPGIDKMAIAQQWIDASIRDAPRCYIYDIDICQAYADDNPNEPLDYASLATLIERKYPGRRSDIYNGCQRTFIYVNLMITRHKKVKVAEPTPRETKQCITPATGDGRLVLQPVFGQAKLGNTLAEPTPRETKQCIITRATGDGRVVLQPVFGQASLGNSFLLCLSAPQGASCSSEVKRNSEHHKSNNIMLKDIEPAKLMSGPNIPMKVPLVVAHSTSQMKTDTPTTTSHYVTTHESWGATNTNITVASYPTNSNPGVMLSSKPVDYSMKRDVVQEVTSVIVNCKGNGGPSSSSAQEGETLRYVPPYTAKTFSCDADKGDINSLCKNYDALFFKATYCIKRQFSNIKNSSVIPHHTLMGRCFEKALLENDSVVSYEGTDFSSACTAKSALSDLEFISEERASELLRHHQGCPSLGCFKECRTLRAAYIHIVLFRHKCSIWKSFMRILEKHSSRCVFFPCGVEFCQLVKHSLHLNGVKVLPVQLLKSRHSLEEEFKKCEGLGEHIDGELNCCHMTRPVLPSYSSLTKQGEGDIHNIFIQHREYALSHLKRYFVQDTPKGNILYVYMTRAYSLLFELFRIRVVTGNQ